MRQQTKEMIFLSTVALILTTMVVRAYAGQVPDNFLTPGVIRPLTQEQVCATHWGKDARHVTLATKRKVFHNYGLTGYADPKCIPDAKGRTCELDHRIARSLGGADNLRNVWPQSYGGEWSAVQKDKLEVKLSKTVCKDKSMTLGQAQGCLLRDWRVCYKEVFD